jgi:hypothetical protein
MIYLKIVSKLLTTLTPISGAWQDIKMSADMESGLWWI